ncbi:MAG: uracil-xanthine permease [Clostridia bacterium]|nr:uracil-xanthine permease [Clostridia bacterium]
MKNVNLVYGVKDKPGIWKTILFALQQVLAILAATIVVPVIINGNMAGQGHIADVPAMSQSAALLGAGVGTIVYLLFTKFKSPVFLGSSFAFIGSMTAAFAGAVGTAYVGYFGILLGAIMAGLVYVVIALIVKFAGVNWINKLMPAAVIGPTVAIIGLSLSGNAIGDLFKGSVMTSVEQWVINSNGLPELVNSLVPTANSWLCLLCGLTTLAVVIICSVYGKKMLKIIPFIIGILAGYALAAIFTVIGILTENTALQIINFGLFKDMQWLPDFTFVNAIKSFSEFKNIEGGVGSYIGSIAVAYIPVAFVVFAEHLADHKNISSIIDTDLLKDPGLHRTLLGDGVGSMAGAFFGGCPNTSYGESVGCVAISGNASIVTILTAAFICIVAAFLAPLMTLLATIPSCVMGGVCMTLYGFIAVSGLKMIQKVDLSQNHNLFTVSVILIAGVGGMVLNIGKITITSIACALILGILTNLLTLKASKKAAAEKTAEEKAE